MALFLGLIGCNKNETEPEPQQPQLSCGTTLSLVEGETSAEITISGGVAPYTIQPANETVEVTFTSETKVRLRALLAGNVTLTIKGKDNGETQLVVSVSEDPNKAFKEDATVRVEKNGTVFTPLDHTFVVDKGGYLLGSSQIKVGCTLDGNIFNLIGWDPGYQNPRLYTQEGMVPLSNLQVLQERDGKIWLIGTTLSLTVKICVNY
ncbi:MAG: hypothetical protein LBG52_06000 [Candidatus Peribacteria bacterium]|nr:hypothetical protein [Candidatus Peribacteria bacterium]